MKGSKEAQEKDGGLTFCKKHRFGLRDEAPSILCGTTGRMIGGVLCLPTLKPPETIHKEALQGMDATELPLSLDDFIPPHLQRNQKRGASQSYDARLDSSDQGDLLYKATMVLTDDCQDSPSPRIERRWIRYEGIGPTDDDGMPFASRSSVDKPREWYKNMYKILHQMSDALEKQASSGGIGNTLKQTERGTALNFRKAKFDQLRDALNLVDWDNILRNKNTDNKWEMFKNILNRQYSEESDGDSNWPKSEDHHKEAFTQSNNSKFRTDESNGQPEPEDRFNRRAPETSHLHITVNSKISESPNMAITTLQAKTSPDSSKLRATTLPHSSSRQASQTSPNYSSKVSQFINNSNTKHSSEIFNTQQSHRAFSRTSDEQKTSEPGLGNFFPGRSSNTSQNNKETTSLQSLKQKSKYPTSSSSTSGTPVLSPTSKEPRRSTSRVLDQLETDLRNFTEELNKELDTRKQPEATLEQCEHGNQGKHRVTKRGPALSYPMFTLVTGIVGRWRAVCVTALQRPNSDAAAIRIVVGIAAASLNVKGPLQM
ncbi:unnamed protein product [Ranitomeya imitator]|uniref:SoHo domain-containing protein n=1 Tax=Ranitomeya imitator TaxID=111125 RepID=A0ABN9M439_9NEOB|nr:unnamed protein product [Ranitomeya imitator]